LLPVCAWCYETTVNGANFLFEEYKNDYPNQGSNNVVKMCSVTGIDGIVPDSLIIPDSLDGFLVVHIGYHFLENNKDIKHVKLPLYCREIANYAFMNCSNLESVVMESHIEYVHPNVFEGCDNLRSIKCYALDPPTYWREMNPSIHFSEEVRNNATLYVRPGCKNAYKRSVVWSELSNFEEMDVPAFRVGDERVGYVNGVRYVYTILSVEDMTCLFGRMVTNTTLIVGIDSQRYHDGPEWRAVDFGLTGTIRIPSEIDGFTVTELGYGCLHYANPDSVIVPGTVKKIWGNMCSREISKSLIIGASVEDIGPYIPIAGYIEVDPSNTVYDSRNGSNVIMHTSSNTLLRVSKYMHTIPDGVVAVGDYAFSGLSVKKEDMEKLSSVERYGEGAFERASIYDYNTFKVPSSMAEIPQNMFRYCGGISSVVLHDKVTKICDEAFCHSGISEVNIPASIEYIGDLAFCECYSLMSLNLLESDNLYYIGKCAFCETALYNLILPNHAISMGERAFGGARHPYRSIVIPENFDGFGVKAFSVYNSSGQTYEVADKRGQNLTMDAISVIISEIENPSAIDSDLFDEFTLSNTELYVPDGKLSLYQSTSGWNQFKYIMEISDMPTGIKDAINKGNSPVSVYAPNGIKLDPSTDGLHIIKMSNGDTRKVMIK